MSEDETVAFAVLRLLPQADVSPGRAERLRAACHRELRNAAGEPSTRTAHAWQRLVGPALIGAWGAAYLIETLRVAAAVYGF